MITYDERAEKPSLHPRHPIVCLLDIGGILSTLFFLLQSAHWVNRTYLASIVLLYLVSATYHWCVHKDWLRRLDHIMIFVVIAMTAIPYWGVITPFAWRPAGPLIIATLIIFGAIIKFFDFFSKGVSGGLYILSGLPIVTFFLLHWSEVPSPFNLLWAIGSCLYLFQLLIYTFHWFNFKTEILGYREIQHCVLLMATSLHSYTAVELVG